MTKIKEKKTKTASTSCELQDLLFPVSVVDEPMWCNNENSKRVIGVIGGREKLLNQCSPVYALVENEKIFPNIEATLTNNGIEFEADYKHINHVRFYCNYMITDKRYAYHMKGTNDLIYPMLRVQHSYNGLTVYKIIFGYFRLICGNGATVPVAEMNEYNLVITGKHTEVILHSFERLNVMLQKFVESAGEITKAITNRYELLAERWRAKPEERLIQVLEATKISVVENSKFNTVNDIMNRIMVEANTIGLGYYGKVNDWLIYNGINQYINDDSRYVSVPEKRMEIDSKVLEFMLENE